MRKILLATFLIISIFIMAGIDATIIHHATTPSLSQEQNE